MIYANQNFLHFQHSTLMPKSLPPLVASLVERCNPETITPAHTKIWFYLFKRMNVTCYLCVFGCISSEELQGLLQKFKKKTYV